MRVTVRDVRFDEARLYVEMSDGRVIGTPIRWYPRLANATPEQRANWQPCGAGESVALA